jgi:hypothetical protein
VYTSIANFAILWASIDRLCPGLPGHFRRRELCGLVDAQNAQIWTAGALIGIKPRSAQLGGTVRVMP